MKVERKMLDRWAAHLVERRTIEAFMDWLESQKMDDIRQREWSPDKWLDEYHGINGRQLEKERRELLATMK